MSYIYQQINESDFIDAMTQTYDNTNFTYEGKQALYEYLTQLAEDTGMPVELDTIALCCEYTEYQDWEDFHAQYPDIKDFEDLNNYTTVIEVDNAMKSGFIIQNF